MFKHRADKKGGRGDAKVKRIMGRSGRAVNCAVSLLMIICLLSGAFPARGQNMRDEEISYLMISTEKAGGSHIWKDSDVLAGWHIPEDPDVWGDLHILKDAQALAGRYIREDPDVPAGSSIREDPRIPGVLHISQHLFVPGKFHMSEKFSVPGGSGLNEEEPPQPPRVEKSAEKFYKEALFAWITGDYEKAIELFKKIGDYKNSKSIITYLTALLLERGGGPGAIENAIELYMALDGFLDSAQRLLMLRERRVREEYTRIDNPFKNAAAGDLVEFGRYDQDADSENGPEAVRWRVLSVEEGRSLAVSEYGLDARPYNDSDETISWENCSLRKWLNEDFYQAAFNEDESKLIILTDVRNDYNPDFRIPGGNDTEDKIFLLSIAEVQSYFPDNKDSMCHLTETAKKNGAAVFDAFGTGWWWLRSPGSTSSNAAYVHYTGSLLTGGSNVSDAGVSVRPAMYVNTISDIFKRKK